MDWKCTWANTSAGCSGPAVGPQGGPSGRTNRTPCDPAEQGPVLFPGRLSLCLKSHSLPWGPAAASQRSGCTQVPSSQSPGAGYGGHSGLSQEGAPGNACAPCPPGSPSSLPSAPLPRPHQQRPPWPLRPSSPPSVPKASHLAAPPQAATSCGRCPSGRKQDGLGICTERAQQWLSHGICLSYDLSYNIEGSAALNNFAFRSNVSRR